MRGYAERCSAISRLFSVGKSVEGRDLWALEISSRPGLEQAKPSFKYVANMHGDEPSGRCLLHWQSTVGTMAFVPCATAITPTQPACMYMRLCLVSPGRSASVASACTCSSSSRCKPHLCCDVSTLHILHG